MIMEKDLDIHLELVSAYMFETYFDSRTLDAHYKFIERIRENKGIIITKPFSPEREKGKK